MLRKNKNEIYANHLILIFLSLKACLSHCLILVTKSKINPSTIIHYFKNIIRNLYIK